MNGLKKGSVDGNGYNVHFIYIRDGVRLNIGTTDIVLDYGDLVLMPTHPDRIIMSLYSHIKNAHSSLSQKSLEGTARQIKAVLDRGDLPEEITRYSKLLIADKIYGIKMVTVASFLDKFS